MEVECSVSAFDALDAIDEKTILDWVYTHDIVPKPEGYVPLKSYKYINVEGDVEERDVLDNMSEDDIVEYVNDNDIIESYDSVISSMSAEEVLKEAIYKIKKNHKCIITSEDVIKYITEKINFGII